MERKEKTLRRIILEHVIFMLNACEFNRTKTAKILDISDRGLRSMIKECRQNGLLAPLLKNKVKQYSCSSFPTNEERIKNLDEFPNLVSGYHHQSSIINGQLIYRRIKKDAKTQKCKT